jgi:arylformamidase
VPWYDISIPITPGMVTFAGDPTVDLVRTATIAGGDVCNVSRLSFGVHSGTHVDAPVHFLDDRAGIEAIDPGLLVGPAVVVDLLDLRDQIDARTVARSVPAGAIRVLFKTPNSILWDDPAFRSDFIGLTADGAAALVDRGVRVVGADYLSIAPFGDPGPTHRTLLEGGVAIIEGLDLRRIEPGPWTLVCLPLLIPGSDGGPARALLGRELLG